MSDDDCDRCGPFTTVPVEFEQRFNRLIEDLENATGKMYELKVHEYGANTDHNIKSFSKRDGYRVYSTAPGYEALEGTYKTLKDLKKKIEELHCSEVTEGYGTGSSATYKLETKTVVPHWSKGKEKVVFVCPKCTKFENNYISPYYMNCSNCGTHFTSKWSGVTVGLRLGDIYKSGGGSISICTTLGHIEVLNESSKGKAPLKTDRPTGKSADEEFNEKFNKLQITQ